MEIKIARRSGELIEFDADKIRVAMANAFLKDAHGHLRGPLALSAGNRAAVDAMTAQVADVVIKRSLAGTTVSVESIQDLVELALMRGGHQLVARDYILFRENQAERRRSATPAQAPLTDAEGKVVDVGTLVARMAPLVHDLPEVDTESVAQAALKELYPGISGEQVAQALLLTTRARIEREPAYNKLTARLLREQLARQVLGEEPSDTAYRAALARNLRRGAEGGLVDRRLLQFDVQRLAQAMVPERDDLFGYMGLQTLVDRYFLHLGGTRIELPQTFFMRVAMGLAINEVEREERAIEFYQVLSSFDYMAATPTLFNSGTNHPQLSSCYLTTVPDDLEGIYDAIKDNAMLSKFAGGLGNDWTPVRALGSHIKGTNGESQGIVPFLKVVNDSAVAVNQGGKRKGAVCAYLETWHLDIEEFLDLRKNTGDDRRRTHDMNTAHWIPDLFMKRVMEDGRWTLFSPKDVPDLHDKYGQAFEEAYQRYEERARRGEMPQSKEVSAVSLWRRMLTMLFETGHPWLTFKDPCNVRSPQQHVGVVHSSNLCTEITLNTSDTEIAVCNLGSVNLFNHLKQEDGRQVLDLDKLRRTVRVAMRMLDNVIDINYYPVAKARHANLRHRPVGLGIMGFQDALHALGYPYASQQAVDWADESMEAVAYFAYQASADLAEERGRYSSFDGSLWSRGILPLDSQQLLAEQRGGHLTVDTTSRLDWDALRARILQVGMRNSNCVAIAPTATISNIVGVSASIEPSYQNLYVKSNLSGEFTVVDEQLVSELKQRGLWDEPMVADLKHYDGRLSAADRIPDDIKRLYATAFEIDPKWLIMAASRRQKWIDQAQSLNIYLSGASGKKLDEVYKMAWQGGLKTTYYLRTLGASSAEKSTGQGGELNAVQVREPEPKLCSIDNPDCEACQ